MINSLSKNTISQYNVALKQWFQFCQLHNTDLYDVTVAFILNFFTHIFQKGASYGTLNSFRSALSLILSKKLSNDENISRFFKGVFRIKPTFPKYNAIWNPNLVLEYLSKLYPNESLNLNMLTKKLVTLLALSTGQRVQTLSLINVQEVNITDSQITIPINEVIKTSRPNRHNPNLIIPFFKQKESICPAMTLCTYISKTSELRNAPNTNKLILTFKKPMHAASPQTISRWIKQTLGKSGVDVSTFSAHSTRHAATSAANRSGVAIDVIKKTAGWTGNSICFAKFYNQPLINTECDSSFAEAIINDQT
ncbi:uncharacterized protein LOC126370882 [Pectinophora gossypiella]|uniref:uncharacterized protein LOC126370882 n=1 Tax=Pectinophora gossypiella TaxID=13191 RepID=UPI00214EA9E5|nr:uncharacterized protein LOC126370882 [Pectinophora gossypiella]